MILLKTAAAAELSTYPLALFAFEDSGVAGPKSLAPAAKRQILELAKAEAFKGTAGECATFFWSGRRLILVGLGKRKDYSEDAQRRAAAALSRFARERFETLAVAPFSARAAAEGLMLGSYRFTEYKQGEPSKFAAAAFGFEGAAEKRQVEQALAKASLACAAVALARDLVNRGPSDKTPAALAELAKSLEGEGLSVEVLDRAKMEELGMGALLAVARGSSVAPAFVHFVYKPKGAAAKRRVGLVGKGITFDSGGLSLKPPASMEAMKMDMAGAAAVLATMKALPKLKPKVEVHGFCAFTYNMPGPDAIKPGDVVRAMNGKTIEILNTDAEGRLILADTLVYAGKQRLDALVDLATLTGACVVALGGRVAGAMGNAKPLLRALSSASEKTAEPLCELPLVRDYKDQIKSAIADVQNIGKIRGEGGAIIGGLFLEEFVDGKPWAHLDIAGPAWADREHPLGPSGGTGAMVRTLLEWISGL